MRASQRTGLCILAPLLWLLLVEPVAAVEVEALVTPAEVSYPETTRITYQLKLRTAGTGERFKVEALPARFGPPDDGGVRQEGSPLALAGEPTIEGTATLGRRERLVAHPACTPSRILAAHGEEPALDTVDVSMPPNASALLTLPYGVTQTPPWPRTDFGLSLTIRPLSTGLGFPPSSQPMQQIHSPGPRRTGPTGVLMSLTTDPPTAPTPGVAGYEIAGGQPIDIRGETEPPIAGERVRLFYLGPDNPHTPRAIGSARVDRRGRFALAHWLPHRRGSYELFARYRSTRPDLVSDYTCPRGFTLASDGPPETRAPRRGRARLELTRVRRQGSGLLVRGRANRLARGRVLITLRTLSGRRLATVTTRLRRGKFTGRFRLSRRASHVRIAVRYRGNRSVRPETRQWRVVIREDASR